VNALDVIIRFKSLGVSLSLDGDSVKVKARRGVLSPDLLKELRDHKEHIREILQRLPAEDDPSPGAPPVTRLPRHGDLPLSFAQQRLWVLDQLEPDSPFYTLDVALRLDGPLDVSALSRSLQEIVRRHEALRTTFPTVEGQARQRIAESWTLPLPVIDLQCEPAEAQEAEVLRRAEEEAVRTFSLAEGPLVRATLLRLSERSHVLLWTMHHIISDGWSMGVLVRELGALYPAFAAGQPSPLPELPIQYADFASWQRQWLAGEVLDYQLAYWKRQLAGAPPALELPTDRPRPAVQSYRGAALPVQLPRALSEALAALSRQEGVTLFMTLLAAFQALLWRYTGQDDIVVGSPIAGRTRAEIAPLIGFFVNTLVLRTDLSGEPTFRELLGRVREMTLGAYAHQDMPFDKLVDELQPERDMSRSPLFQVMFALQNTPMPALSLAEVTLSPLEAARPTAKFDLTLMLEEAREGIRGTLEYRTDLFDRATIERMAGHYRTLLEGIVEAPGRQVSELPMLTAEELHEILVAWNDTGTDYPADRCVHELFEAQAERTPDAVAVVFGDRQLSYRELNQRANQLAHQLRSLGVGRIGGIGGAGGAGGAGGVGPATLVGLCVERSLEMVVGMLGILKAGGAYVPLDPNYPRERLAFMLEDTGAPVLLTQARLLDSLPEHGVQRLCLDTGWEAVARESVDDPRGGAGPSSLAYVIYTSGSTGKPKGVAVTHQAIARLVCNTDYISLGPSDVVAQASSSSFDAATFEIWGALLHGARLVGIDKGVMLSPPDLARRLAADGVTALFITTALFNQVAREAPMAFAQLGSLLFGGEASDPRSVRAALQAGRPRRLLHVYGPTETTTFATWHEVTDVPEGATTVPIGRPIANTRAYVLDRWRHLVPAGIPGELYIGGPGVAQGYLNRPELTEQRFVPDPFSGEPGARMYRTGDLCRWRPDGLLEHLGRSDTQVKIRGFRIELGEIESALAQHPAVREAVVLAREDSPGDKRLVAYLVTREAPLPGAGELRSYLQGRLPEFMIPTAFVELEALPLSPNGKIDRKALPAPEGRRLEHEQAVVAPRTRTEEALAGIWAEVLRLDRVGILDNFFALGGDSILAIQVISKAQRAGLGLSVRQLFQHQTVAALAAVSAEAASPGAEQGPVAGPVVLTPIQRWFFDQERPDPHHFNQSVLLEARERLDLPALERAVRHLVQHHDALRLRFTREGDEVRQINARADETVTVATVDLSAVPAAEQAEAIAHAAAEVQGSLCLEAGPLMRVAVLDLGQERPSRLLIVIHHLAVDGVSWRILIEDLDVAYAQARRGEAARLPPKTTSFQRWSERLSAYAQSEVVREELSHWRSLPEATALPVDQEGGDNTVGSSRTVEVALGVEETRALLQEVPEVYRTQINDVLLLALAQALAPWTGARRLRIDLEGHGREEIAPDLDLSRTVGWFTALFPVVIDLPEAPLGAAIKSVKEQLRWIPSRGLGHGLLRYLHADASIRESLAAAPRAEVSFNYLGQFDQGAAGCSAFGLAAEPSGPMHSPRGARTHLLDVIGSVAGGKLRVGWTYSEHIHRRATIEGLAERFMAALRAVVAHCRSPEAGGRTPSDFPLTRLTQAAVDRLVGRGREVEDIYPLSPMQQGMLFHSLRDPTSGIYVEQHTFRSPRGLVVPAFKEAWIQMLERHSVLRSAFAWEGLEEPLQIVRAGVALPWVEEDWRDLPAGEREARLAAFLAEDRARGFDLTAAPLMRLTLLRLTDEAYQVVWSFHHVLMDGWSLPILFTELLAFYGAIRAGSAVHLPAPRPYRDHIAWLKQQDLARAEAFWREALLGFSAPTPLPMSRPRGGAAAEVVAASLQERRLSAEATEALERFARAHGLTLNTVLQGAWALLLSRYSGEEDVVFGATTSGRSTGFPGMDSMVGLFINTLPVRVQAAPDAAIVPWLERLQERQAEQLPYAYSPLAQVQGWSEVPRGQPLFESLLVVENYPVAEALQRGDISIAIEDVQTAEQTNYPLTVSVIPGRELALQITFAADRFDEAAIARVLGHYQTLIEGIMKAPERRVSELSLLTAEEREELLVAWNDTRAEYPEKGCIHDLFEQQAARTPDAIAVVSGDQRLTYAELNRRANQLAHHLRSLRVGPEVLVGLCLERSPSMLVGLLAILKAGGAYVPLDPTYPGERLAFTLQDSGAPVVLTEERLAGRLDVGEARVIRLDADRNILDRQPTDNPEPAAAPDNLAYVIYTSGSTGTPKGVMIPHRALVNHALATAQAFELSARDRVLQFASISFDAAAEEIFPAWLRGATLVLRNDEVLAPEAFQRWIARERLTVLDLPTAFWHHWVSAIEASGDPLPPSLRLVIIGGERAASADYHAWQRVSAGRVCCVNTYGPTEATVTATLYHPSREQPLRPGAEVPIGRAIANARLYVLDAHLQPVPVGVPGELYIGGAGLARGYLLRPGLTQQRFLPDPFCNEHGARIYRTGDLCRWLPDGMLEYLGRVDHQVKIRGFRVELGEIESVLALHPAVRDAVVLAREDAPGEARLVAYLVAAETPLPGPGELRSYLQARLPDYMVPAAFVHLAVLPLLPSGKVDRKALPAPDGQRPDQERAFVAPRTPVEEVLSGVWAEVLHLDQVGIFDDFFTLGGHSLLATQAVARLRPVFGVEIPLRALFEAPTVAALAGRIEAALRAGATPPAPPLVPVPREGELPLSFAQQRLWFLDQLEPDSPFYTMPAALRLEGPLDVGALSRSLAEIVRRHEALRTTFPTVDGQGRQRIAEAWTLSLPVLDLTAEPPEAREAEVRRLAEQEARRPFSLSQGPLVRAALIRLAEQSHVLLWTMHHIISDGWSMGVLVREVGALYAAFAAGQPSPLPELSIQYADFAAWQRRWLSGEVLDAQLAYWKKKFAGAPPALELPTDRPRPPVQTFRGAALPVQLPRALSDALVAFSREEGVTLFMTLLAAFQALLSRYTGQDDIVVGSPIAGRTRAEVEPLIGFFINTLVLRADLSGEPTFRELVRRVREVTLGAYTHQDVPFEKLVEELEPRRDLSRSPLFQVMFVLQNAPMPELSLGNLKICPLEVESTTAKFDLTLLLEETEDGIQGALEYNTDLFDPATVERMAGHLETLLAGVVEAPEQRVSEIPILTAAERQQLLVTWNDTRAEYPRDLCVHALFEAQVERTPDAAAVIFEGQELSYRELNRRANQLAYHLRTLGVGPEVLVGLCVERSVEMVVGILGILKAGGAYVPLDPTYPRERLAFMLEDTGAPVLLTQERLASRLPARGVKRLCLDADRESIAREPIDNPVSGAGPESLVYVIYTSGSTGTPKGVMIHHRGLVNYLSWGVEAYRVAEGQGSLVHSSIGFDLTITGLYAPLLVGKPVTLIREAEAESLAEALRAQEDLSLVKLTPAHLTVLNHLLPPEAAARRTRAFVIGGEALSWQSLSFFQRYAPETRLINEYGPTETVVGCCVYDAAGGPGAPGSVPIGRPIANTALYVLDAHLQPVPIGVPGELYIGGDGVARGYLNRPDLTRERFPPDPFGGAPGARMYRTGDLCRYRADGNLEFLGRLDHQVKIRGFRIELGEIESLLAQHPAVRDAVVIAREDSPGDRRLVAYLVAREARLPGADAMRSYLKASLPEPMIPAAFVELPALPLSPNGKVDRRALPAPDGQRPEHERAFVAPRTPAEEVLAGIWAEVLRIDRVGALDSFFTLGGDSILAIQVISKAQRAGLGLSVRQLFQHQTVAALAAVAAEAASPGAEQGSVTGPVVLTPVQRWFFDQERLDPHHFNQSVMLEARERLDLPALERAIRHLVQHHDALRLRFTRDGAEVRQVNAPADETVTVATVDLSGVSAAEQAEAIEQAAAEVQGSLCLEAGPLMRVAMLDLGPERSSRLLIVIHHLAVDGVSWRILLEDLETAYTEARRGEAPRLPPKTTSFQRWAERLSAHAQSDAVREELSCWRSLPATSPLPVDQEGRDNTVASSRIVEVALGVEETRALLQEVPEVYRTQINDVLLLALVQAFAPWTGTPRLRIDLEGHGREELAHDVDLSRTVGWFTTLFPVVIELPEAPLDEAIKSVKEQLRRIPNRGLGHGLLRYLHEDASIRAELAAAPQAEVIFNYLGQLDPGVKALFRFAEEPGGPAQSPRGARTHLLDVTGSVVGGQLRVVWDYSEHIHRRATIEGLARRFLEALRAIVAHCKSPDAGGRTPSDFPLTRLNQAAVDRLVGRGREVEDLYPLSPMQQGMLFHSLRDPTSGVYVEQLSFRVPGGLVIPAFKEAWKQALERHSILRSAFVWEGVEEPLQIVRASLALPWAEQDWRDVPANEREARLSAFLADDRARGFDLTAAPLMRLTLLRLTDEAVQVVWSCHHILFDGWSLPILIKEVLYLYEAACRGTAIHLPAPRPYRDYIAWLLRQDLGSAEGFWRNALRGFKAPTPLSIGLPGSGAAARAAQVTHERRLSAEATEALERFARAHGLTLNTVVQGAWGLLLSRYSGEEEVVFGATASGRSIDLPGIDSMVGLFINTLPVRLQAAPEAPVVPWLRALQERQAEQLPHAYSPLAQVQGWSELPRGQALFESLLVVENYPVDEALQHGDGPLAIDDVQSAEQTSYPLTVAVVPGRELALQMTFAADRFDEAAIERMLGHYQALIEGLMKAPERRVSELSLLTAEEREELLVAWNDTRAEYPEKGCIHDLFEQQAARTPDAIAVACGDQHLTYGELNLRANQLARHLRSLGVGPEVLVGLCVERSLSMVVGLLGILKAGGAYVPLDPAYPRERLAFMLQDSGAPVVLTEERLAGRLDVVEARVIRLDADQDAISRQPAGNPEALAAPDNLAYVIYTSGSTGTPKGVMVHHRALVNHALSALEAFELSARDRVLQFASISFDAAAEEIFPTWICGATLVLRSDDALAPEAFLRWIERERLTVLDLPTAFWHHWVSALETSGDALPPALRLVVIGGERAASAVYEAWQRVSAGRVDCVNTYGPTETTVTATLHHPRHERPLRPGAEVPIGRGIANARLYVLDSRLQPAPVGVPGELYIGGAGVARGYLHRPALTGQRFLLDPFSKEPGARMYRTGDRCRWLPDGLLEYLGRVDHQVKIRGFRIELGEIESVLGQHPAVREAVVLAREDSPGDRRLVAYLVTAEMPLPGAGELRNYLQAKLPDHMIPAAFVHLPALPLLPGGKVDRKALPAPEGSRSERGSLVGPRDAVELELTRIWEDLLGVSPLGVRDDFFLLGGHSLLAIQMIGLIKEVFGRALPLATLFEAPTVEALARRLREQESPRPWSPLVALQPSGRGRPFFCVHPLEGHVSAYFDLARHMGNDRPFYGLQAAGQEEGQALDARIEDMAARYIEALRTVQPEGPYLLGGWSLGGVVAFEMAHQLSRRGHQVARVVLLDSGSPEGQSGPVRDLDDDASLILAFARGAGAHLTPDELGGLGPDEQIGRLLELLIEGGLLPPGFSLERMKRWFAVTRSNLRALEQYAPRVYPGQLTLFRSSEEPTPPDGEAPEVAQEPTLGWGALSAQPVTVLEVPGDHQSMLKPPQVQILANKLRACLLDADPAVDAAPGGAPPGEGR